MRWTGFVSVALHIWTTASLRLDRRERCTLLVADYNNAQGVRDISRMVQGSNCSVHVVAKGPGGCLPIDAVANVTCEPAANFGREFETYSTWVARHYDALPDVVLTCPSSLEKWNRKARLQMLLSKKQSDKFNCSVDMSERSQVYRDGKLALRIGDWSSMTKDSYMGNALVPANPRGLGQWLKAHAGLTQPLGDFRVCTNGLFRTTRALLSERPQRFYEELAHELRVGNAPEAGHYVELSARLFFGGSPSPRYERALTIRSPRDGWRQRS